MSAVNRATGAKTARSETISVRIDPKIRYLAELGAREKQRTLSSFVEWAIRKALTLKSMSEEEPNYGPTFSTEQPPLPLWNDGLWDVDEADRFFHLAMARHDLLTIPEQRLWKLLSGSIALNNDGKIDLKTFREYWNSPHINTAHLKTESNEGGE